MPKTIKKPVALIILDGWGYREDATHNAIAQAKTPFFDHIWETHPHALLEASGLAVGLPEGQVGNSEIGHTTIGAGTVLDTDLVRIKKSIDSGGFEKNPAFLALFKHVKKYDSTLHVQGLLGHGGVHAHSDHLHAFLRAAKKNGIKKIAIHAFTDGRDTPPQSSAEYMRELEAVLAEVGIGEIATITGRYYAMDRDNNWDRIALAEKALFEGKGELHISKTNKTGNKTGKKILASDILAKLHKEGMMDEHLKPIVFLDEKGTAWPITKNDAILFYNFRSDRARQITTKILEKQKKLNLAYATLTEYDASFKCHVAFAPVRTKTTLAAEISKAGLSQAHIAETEKFPHVTYFMNGGKEKPHKKEKHILLDSRKDVKTHDLAPHMRAEAIADAAIREIKAGTNFILINFANPDMVGHTANVPAIIEAIEKVDLELKRVITTLLDSGGTAFVTADHGNAEINIDPETGAKHTAHTTSLVPAILVTSPAKNKGVTVLKLSNGGLSDIAPTLLKLLRVKKPKTMSGKELI